MSRRLVGVQLVIALFACASVALAASNAGRLPPETLRGPENLLLQYPTLSLASPAQRAAAERVSRDARTAARRWGNPRAAKAAGFDTHTVKRRSGDRTVHYLHAEHRRYSADSAYLDGRRPEALIYANIPGQPLVLVGMMFSMPRGKLGPTPGGPITRWHTHRVCVRGKLRGLAPRADGSCPRGTKARQGSEMLHLWFTNDLRSTFAIHAPARELGLSGLLPAAYCKL